MEKLRIRIFVAAVLSMLVLTRALGQETGSSESEEATAAAPRSIEEITVVGQQSLFRLRLRIKEKEEEIFAFFNANNSHDRFDILCTSRRPTGTHILKRECEPKFLKDLRVQRTRDARMGLGVRFTQLELVELSAENFEKLHNEMLQLMATNKEFSDNLADLADLTENYEAHRKEMFDIED